MKSCIVLSFLFAALTANAERIPVILVKGTLKTESFIQGSEWRKTGMLIPAGVAPVHPFSESDYIIIYGVRYEPIAISRIRDFAGNAAEPFVYPEVLVSGTVSLYSLHESNHLLIAKDGIVYEVNKLDQVSSKWKATNTDVLVEVLNDCREAGLWDTQNAQFDETALQRMVVLYNRSCGEHRYRLRMSQWTFGVSAGYRKSNYNVGPDLKIRNAYIRGIRSTEGLNTNQPYAGIEVNLQSTRESGYLAVALGLYYNHVHGESASGYISQPNLTFVDSIDSRVSLDIKQLSMEFVPQFVIAKGPFRYTLGLGLRGNFRLFEEGEFVQDVLSLPPFTDKVSITPLDASEYGNFTGAMIVQVGASYERLFIVAELSRGINEYFNATVEHVNGFSLRLGYQLYRSRKIEFSD